MSASTSPASTPLGRVEFAADGPDRARLSHANQNLGYLSVVLARPLLGFPPQPLPLIHCESSSARTLIRFHHPAHDVAATIEIAPHESLWQGSIRATGSGPCILRLVWELPAQTHGFPFVPAFMYGDNRGAAPPHVPHPQLGHGGRPKPWLAPQWLMRTDRSSHGCSAVITDNLAFALGGRDVCWYDEHTIAEKTGLGTAIEPHRMSYSLGFWNSPVTYSPDLGRNFVPRPEGYIQLDRGDVHGEFFLYLAAHHGRADAAGKLLRAVYSVLHDTVPVHANIPTAVTMITDAIIEHGYSPQAHNFSMLIRSAPLLPDPDFPSAWCCGLQAAYPLILAGHSFTREDWLCYGRDVIDHIANHGRSPHSGLFYENYNLPSQQFNNLGWWWTLLDKPAHSGYVNGQVCYYLLASYLLEKQAGIDQPHWLNAAQQVLDLVAQRRTADHRFGYLYSEDNGQILDSEGFSGCWFVPAFALLHQITGQARYLQIARQAMDAYRPHLDAFCLYGGPLDIFKSPDSEGALAWIRAAHVLCEVTGEEQFLRDLLAGLDYEFSWKFSYNVVNELEPLKSLNWCSTGGTVTSAHNAHVHPMSCMIIDDILFAWKKTNDPYLRSRLIDTVHWAMQCYEHPARRYGWRDGLTAERFCHSDSLLTERFPDGRPASTWFTPHPWASSSVLEGLCGDVLAAFGQNSPDAPPPVEPL
jgi:hypothetical protein